MNKNKIPENQQEIDGNNTSKPHIHDGLDSIQIASSVAKGIGILGKRGFTGLMNIMEGMTEQGIAKLEEKKAKGELNEEQMAKLEEMKTKQEERKAKKVEIEAKLN